MTEAPPTSPIVNTILSGDRTDLKRLAAEGLAPLPLEDLLELQVVLAADDDAEIAALAATSLAETEPRFLARVIQERAGSGVAEYFARHSENAEVLRAVLGRKGLDPKLVESLARRVPEELQEQLLLRQDAIIERPAILEALEENPRISTYTRRRIAEYRTHLPVRESKVGEDEADAVDDGVAEDELPDELQTRVEVIRRIFVEASRGEFGDLPEEVARLTEAQIRQLPTTARVALCRRAPRTLRMILVRDQHPEVARAVMRLNRLTEDEVEQVVRSRTVIVDILELIALDRVWTRRYSVLHSLVKNPKTPLAIAMRFLPRLTVRHLRDTLRDRNLPEAIRERAKQLYTIKTR